MKTIDISGKVKFNIYNENVTNLLESKANKSVKFNSDGSFETCLLEFNVPSGNGVVYTEDVLRKCFEGVGDNAKFVDKIKHGSLYGEVSHPPQPYDLKSANRAFSIDSDNVVFKIKKIWINSEKKQIRGILEPAEPKGNTLKERMIKGENSAFSMRAYGTRKNRETIVNGHRSPSDLLLITWDYVDIPGVKNARPGGNNFYVESYQIDKKDMFLNNKTGYEYLENLKPLLNKQEYEILHEKEDIIKIEGNKAYIPVCDKSIIVNANIINLMRV